MRTTLPVTLALGAVIAVAAFFGGRELRGEPEAPVNAFDTTGPSFFANPPVVAESVAGFTGDGALGGRPVFSGEVVSIDGSMVTISTPSGEMTIEVSDDSKLWQLESYSGAIEPGDNVVVRREGETAVAVLLVER
jgi:hypothetical protein